MTAAPIVAPSPRRASRRCIQRARFLRTVTICCLPRDSGWSESTPAILSPMGPKDTATTTTVPVSAAVADEPPTAVLLLTLSVGDAGPAPPLEADPLAPVAEPWVRRHVAVDAALSEPFSTGPDRGAPPSVAKPIAALAVARAVAIRHILGPRPGVRQPARLPTIEGDCLVERRKRFFGRRGARVHGFVRRGRPPRRARVGVLDAHARRRLVGRSTGDGAGEARRSRKPHDEHLCTGPVHVRPHGYGHWHPGSLPPGPPR